MATFVMLTNLTPEGVQTLKNNPTRIQEVNKEVEQLGVTVKESEVARRLPTGQEEGDTHADTFAHDTVENQIRVERLFARVTSGEMSAGERNTTWAEFLARLRRETKVRYEPGYGPGS